jgi:hypothetical protein
MDDEALIEAAWRGFMPLFRFLAKRFSRPQDAAVAALLAVRYILQSLPDTVPPLPELVDLAMKVEPPRELKDEIVAGLREFLKPKKSN